MKKITAFEINTSNVSSSGANRQFTIKGDYGAVFSMIVTNEDPKYYNFTDNVFQAAFTKLTNIEIPSSGVYYGNINIPLVSDDDQYDIKLFAESHFNTYFSYYVSGATITIPIITKTIKQYTDTTVAFAVASKEFSTR